MRLLALLAIVATLGLWSWSTAMARSERYDGVRSAEIRTRCAAGYRKSTVTARCVRIGARLPGFSWN